MVIVISPDIGVINGLCRPLSRWQRLFIKAFFQNRIYAFIRVGADRQGAGTRIFKPLWAVTFSQAHDTQAGSKSLLGMDSAVDDLCNHLLGMGSGFFGPSDDA